MGSVSCDVVTAVTVADKAVSRLLSGFTADISVVYTELFSVFLQKYWVLCKCVSLQLYISGCHCFLYSLCLLVSPSLYPCIRNSMGIFSLFGEKEE